MSEQTIDSQMAFEQVPCGRGIVALEQQDTDAETMVPKLWPRIYVASLSDYNAGRLHGVWIEANRGGVRW